MRTIYALFNFLWRKFTTSSDENFYGKSTTTFTYFQADILISILKLNKHKNNNNIFFNKKTESIPHDFVYIWIHHQFGREKNCALSNELVYFINHWNQNNKNRDFYKSWMFMIDPSMTKMWRMFVSNRLENSFHAMQTENNKRNKIWWKLEWRFESIDSGFISTSWLFRYPYWNNGIQVKIKYVRLSKIIPFNLTILSCYLVLMWIFR